MEPRSIAVVGGGMAGLSCAYELQKYPNFDVTVLEAKKRLGGRILTVLKNGNPVELGGENFYDGTDITQVKRIAHELRVNLIVGHRHINTAYYNGSTIVSCSDLKNQAPTKEKIDEVMAQVEKYNNIGEVLEAIVPKTSALYHYTAARMCGWEGSPIEQLSVDDHTLEILRDRLEMPDFGICPVLRVEGGNAHLILAMAKKVKVLLNMPLKKAEMRDNKVALITEDGTTRIFDIVVFAIPAPAFWNIAIDSKLIPEKQLQLIRNIQYGIVSKVIANIKISNESRNGVTDTFGVWPNLDEKTLTMFYLCEYFDKSLFMKDKEILPHFKIELEEASEPVDAEDEQFKVYEKAVAKCWPKDPDIKGSYANLGVGKTNDMFGASLSGLYVKYAGDWVEKEETKTERGTMARACETGVAAAWEIIAEFKQDK